MVRVLLAPDKFKGTLTAAEVAAHVAAGLRSVLPTVDVSTVPVADGGDGTLAYLARRSRESLTDWRTRVRGVSANFVILSTGEVVQMVGWDRASVSVMRSYPNLIPVGPAVIARVRTALQPLVYDRLYSAWPGHHIAGDGRRIVERSFDRYLAQIGK